MKKIKIITIILAIILVTLVAFGGIYIKTQNRMENKVKDYAFGRELAGGRIVELKPSTTEDSQKENLTIENYEIIKKTIEKRLDNLGADDYTISLNNEDGLIRVELAEDDKTDTYAYFLTADGKVQIKEKDTNTEVLNDSMVEKALYNYTANKDNNYQVYLELYLTQEGQTKIEEIKNNYAIFANEIEEIEKAEEEAEEGTEVKEGETAETENKQETKKIALLTVAGSEYDIDKIEKNKITLKIGEETTNTTSINNNLSVAAELALLINSGKYPITYEIINNRYEYSDITKQQMKEYMIYTAIAFLIIFISLTVQYKTRGLLVNISYIGFVSILSLILRYTNVMISIEGLAGILLILYINFNVNDYLLKNAQNADYKNLFNRLIPIIILTLVFSFTKWANLSSFGMIMFWGLILIVAYNIFVTKTLLKLKESK